MCIDQAVLDQIKDARERPVYDANGHAILERLHGAALMEATGALLRCSHRMRGRAVRKAGARPLLTADRKRRPLREQRPSVAPVPPSSAISPAAQDSAAAVFARVARRLKREVISIPPTGRVPNKCSETVQRGTDKDA